MRVFTLFIVAIAILVPTASGQTIVYVEHSAAGDGTGSSWTNACTTIQAGINAASGDGGSEVWVAEGTYGEARDNLTGSVVLADNVELYGGFIGLGVGGNEDERSLRNWNEHPTTINGSASLSDGNAQHVIIGANNAVLDGFTITGGNASETGPRGYGGALWNNGTSPSIINCTFTSNQARSNGGAIMNQYGAAPEIADCLFVNNTALYGGAIHNSQSPAIITNCTFRDNTASYGGAMYSYESEAVVTGCRFESNDATTGGGMHNQLEPSARILNCVFLENTASNDGGGMSNYMAATIIINCTFSANTATNIGGAMRSTLSSSPTITNCIMWGDSSPEMSSSLSSTPEVTHSNIQGGHEGDGNIDADPLFSNVETGDLSIRFGSPCIDTGDSDTDSGDDIDGRLRPFGPGVDMGAHEWEVRLFYVDHDNGSGIENGDTWAMAFRTIQAGVNAANSSGAGDVLVAEGTYTSAANQVVAMKANVRIYGGFPSGGDFSQRDFATHETIVDGQDARRCVVGSDDSTIDGLTIANGRAQGAGPDGCGGGMLNSSVSPAISNCFFRNNSASNGGGICNDISVSRITHCSFEGNAAVNGGGIHNNSASVTISECTFTGNDSASGGGVYNYASAPSMTGNLFDANNSDYGGAIYNDISAPTVETCTMQSNSALSGAGIYNKSSSPSITNSIFMNNTATLNGGVLYNDGSSPSVTNCTLTGNTATSGGAMYNDASDPAIRNCILWNDSAPEIFDANDASPIVIYSDVSGFSGGEENIDADPTFADTDAGNFALLPGSPCIDSGTDAGAPGKDFEGVTRPQGSGYDMGAYEIPKCSARFSASPLSGTEPLEVQFTDESVALAGIVSWSWDFGDGGSEEEDPSHIYAENGVYSVSLTVEETGVDSDTTTKTHYITVLDGMPTAALSGDTEVEEGAEGNYSASSSSSPADDIALYEWDWDYDGETFNPSEDTGATQTHTWNAVAHYTVALRVTDDDGPETDIATLYVAYGNPAPEAAFSANEVSGTEQFAVTFVDESSSLDGIVSRAWNFGDGETGSGENPTHVYGENGTYSVSLTVTEGDGDTDTITQTDYITVSDGAPVAAITGNHSLVSKQAGAFDASGSTSPGDAISLYEWDFDHDGTMFVASGSTGPSAVRAWNTPGAYTVAVRVTDDDGPETDIATLEIIVSNAPPSSPEISVSPDPALPAQDLVCTIVSPGSDIETPEEQLQYSYTWTRSGAAAIAHGPTTLLSDTLSFAETAEGQTWICEARTYDGELFSGPVSIQVEVIPDTTVIDSYVSLGVDSGDGMALGSLVSVSGTVTPSEVASVRPVEVRYTGPDEETLVYQMETDNDGKYEHDFNSTLAGAWSIATYIPEHGDGTAATSAPAGFSVSRGQTQLSMNLSSQTIDVGSTVDISGRLYTNPAIPMASILEGHLITLTLVEPGYGVSTITATTDAAGDYEFLAVAFAGAGQPTASVGFDGDVNLGPASSSPATIEVRTTAGYAILIAGGLYAEGSEIDSISKTTDDVHQRFVDRGFAESNILYYNNDDASIVMDEIQAAIES
ncbi:PKD domain-containing protein, partial [Candidatus Hydrogenedentota bacterium]